MKTQSRTGLGCIVAAVASLSAVSAIAQTTAAPPPPTATPSPAPSSMLPNANAGRALEATSPAPSPTLKKDANVLPPADAPRAASSADGPVLMVRGFILTGNTIFSNDELLPLLRPWVGKDATTDQLLDAAEAIKNRYKDAGFFLTQVFVPAQEVPDGIVQLRVLEARIGQTHADVSTQRVKPQLVDGYMALLPRGAAVTEQNVERPLLLLNDLQGVKVTSTLRPGAETGEADLVVKVVDEGRPITGDAYADNAGNVSTGETRLGADLVANGLLGYGESFNFGALVSDQNGLNLFRAGVTAPVGYYGTKATVSVTDLHYKVLGTDFKSIDPHGDALVGSAIVQHPVVRSRNFNLFAIGGLDVKSLTDFSNSLPDKRVLYVGNVGVTGDFRDERFGGSLNSFTLTLAAGHNAIKSSASLQQDQFAGSGHRTNGTYERVNGDFQRLQAITATTSALLSVRGQLAFKNLDTSEKASLGGPHGVRAFAVGDGVGDDVFQGTFELRQRVPAWTLWNAPFVLSAFVDGGRYRNWHDPLTNDTGNMRTLGGYGLGLNLTARDNFQFRLDVAERINKGELTASDNRMTRAWASLQKWF